MSFGALQGGLGVFFALIKGFEGIGDLNILRFSECGRRQCWRCGKRTDWRGTDLPEVALWVLSAGLAPLPLDDWVSPQDCWCTFPEARIARMVNLGDRRRWHPERQSKGQIAPFSARPDYMKNLEVGQRARHIYDLPWNESLPVKSLAWRTGGRRGLDWCCSRLSEKILWSDKLRIIIKGREASMTYLNPRLITSRRRM